MDCHPERAGSPTKPVLLRWGGNPVLVCWDGGAKGLLFSPRLVPIRSQILPGGIYCFYQRDLSPSQPPLKLLLAVNGISNVLVPLEVDQAMNFVVASEPRAEAVLVLPDASLQIVGDPDIEDARLAGHDVDVERRHNSRSLVCPRSLHSFGRHSG